MIKTRATIQKRHRHDTQVQIWVDVVHDSSASYRRSVLPMAWKEFQKFTQTSEGKEILAGTSPTQIEQDLVTPAGGDTASVVRYTLRIKGEN